MVKRQRRSPIRHTVREHTRGGNIVHEHSRGKGTKLRVRKPSIRRREKLRERPTEDISQQAYLKSSGFADKSIVKHINKINEMGFKTMASCSGLRRDHSGIEQRAYLALELPEDVAAPSLMGGIHEVSESSVKDWGYIDALVEAGERVNWNSELSKYMMAFPVVRFGIPKTASVKLDDEVKSDVKLAEEDTKLDEVMKRRSWDRSYDRDNQKFLTQLRIRDAVRRQAYIERGVVNRTDRQKLKMWDDLVRELSKIKKKKKKVKTIKSPEIAEKGERWFTKDRFEDAGRIYHYVGSTKTRAGIAKLVTKERAKAGPDVPLMYRAKIKGDKYRVYVARRDPW